MYLLLILSPFISFLVIIFLGRWVGKNGVIILNFFTIFLNVIFMFITTYEILILKSICYIDLWEWVDFDILNIKFGFLFDAITAIMCFVVFSISTLVHIYSYNYMYNDPHFIRFIAYLSLFTFFMVIIITSNNFIQLFFGWECVGLASYLLINFWYTRIQANKSALKAIFVNKIGDIAIILSLSAIFYMYKTFDYVIIFNLIKNTNYNLTTNLYNFKLDLSLFINFMIFVGVIAKSAQIGLHTWLVDAMEGPTPVSALLHAATMVTVGVFCLIRCNTLLLKSPTILITIMFIGAITAIFGSAVGLLQNDIKRIIAYSTCSQLGYMILSCGLSNFENALYHLTNHAFFKALLFLAAGSIIHSLNGKQDIREMGNLITIQPVGYISFFIGSFALIGLPFFSGFYSKDFILEYSYINLTKYAYFAYILGIISAFFTTFYSIRLIYLVFFSKIKTISKINLLNLHNLNYFIYTPLFILIFFSIFSGFLLKDLFLGLGSDIFESALYISHYYIYNLYSINVENINILIKLYPNILSSFVVLFSIVICILHAIIYYIFNNILKKSTYINKNIFFNKKLFFDNLYYILIKNNLNFSYSYVYKLIDKGFYEIIGPYGISIKIYNISKKFNNLHKKNLYFLIFFFILNIVLLFLLYLFLFNFINPYELIIIFFFNIINMCFIRK